MSADLDISRMLCTRLCHDLAGPVGAISAGIELIGGDPDMIDAEALDLLGMSAGAAGKKLKFLRIAFGSPGKGAVTSDAVSSAFQDYLDAVGGASRPLTVSWLDETESESLSELFGEAVGASLANLVLLCFEAAPGASHVSLTYVQAQKQLSLVAEGGADSQMTLRQDLVDILGGSAPIQLTPHNVQAHFAKKVIEHSGGIIRVQASDGRLSVIVERHG